MKREIFKYLMFGAAVSLAACTDLEVDETDSVVIDAGEFTGVPAASTLNGLYSRVAESNQQNLYALQVATTDEIFIPTRGTDWGDNGVWRDLARHAWTPAHVYNLQTWNYLNQSVYTANQILHPATTKWKRQESDAHFLRAWNMFWIFDLWRQIPYREADEGAEVTPRVFTGEEAFNFIMDDLTFVINSDSTANPDVTADISAKGRASKAAALFLKAKMHLNKHIYLNTGETPATDDLDQVIAIVDQLHNVYGFSLQDGYFSIFAPANDTETILWANAEYAHRIWGGLHYNQGRETDNGGGGWNGFATTADFYNTFEGDENENIGSAADPYQSNQEERRGYVPNDRLGIGFLIGTQYGPDGTDEDTEGDPILARSGNPLVFSKDVPTLTGNPDYTGIRLLKWHPIVNMPGSWGRHLIVMRYADAHLMKAEALFRKGDEAAAQALVDELRLLRDASPIGEWKEGDFTIDDILEERGRELYLEGWKRNDMIRFGKFTTDFAFVDNTEEHTIVFPIPDQALGSNPNLVQNPGY